MTQSPATTAVEAPRAPSAPGGRIGVLLVNLGTPEAPTATAVRRYLREFLTDPRVIEDQGLVWKLVLNLILAIRPARKARDYAKIWNRENNESPLKTITRAQAEKLPAMLGPDRVKIAVDWAMRYGSPSIARRIEALVAQGCDRILVLPLYPQYAAATTATVGDAAFRALMRLRFQPAVRIAQPYFDSPVYIEALASTLEAAIASHTPDIIIASFHGIPKAYVDKGDPYAAHCAETTRRLRERLNLDESKLVMTFQSRFGWSEWLSPYTDKTIEALAKRGVKRVAVITPGFSADCLETLEEIAIENAAIFLQHGGESFYAVPCLNDSTGGMAVISSVVARELKGWV